MTYFARLFLICLIAGFLNEISADPDHQSCDNDKGILIGKKRYYLETYFKANFFTALEFCHLHGMNLASISSQSENDGLNKYITDLGYSNEGFWTSGSDLGKMGSYYWMSTGTPITYTNFLLGEPNHNGNAEGEVERCIEFWNSDGEGFKWNDNYCSIEKFFVCEKIECN